MKAAVYYKNGPPDVLRYEDVPDPKCYPNGVLIKVEAISVEGGDLGNRFGGPLMGNPHIVGYQCAGTIVEAGDRVTDRRVGDRVVATMLAGSHAEMVAVPASFTWLIPPEGDIVECACVPIAFGTAHDSLFEFGHLKEGETVLVQAGASGVGVAAIQLARRAGATVFATASSDERLERLISLGLDRGFNYSGDAWVGEVRSASGTGVNLVVDTVGGRILEGSAKCLGYRGRLISVGTSSRDRRPFDVSLLSIGNSTVTGYYMGAEMSGDRAREMVAALIDDVAAGDLKVVVDRTFPLAEAAKAHEYIESRQAVGRVVLIP
ncbi:MAG: NADP-dependent oxidoreductase [Acidobacteria bacterium]|nr:MAG: NADP-dependent oxidoreductase [Acidobacteriota bacterium]